MLQKMNKMPTLGYFNKIVCDALGLWTSDNKDVAFNVPAKEIERRKALNEAFDAIKREGGSYGNLNDLISVTTKKSPKHRLENKKNKTIQSHINYLSKEDFSSRDEFIELKEYIDIIISERFSEEKISIFASSFHASSIMHYREFIREHSSKPESLDSSYLYFIQNIFIKLIGSDISACSNFLNSGDENSKWPLRSFIDSATELCGISLHKLHQFHEVKLSSGCSDSEIWSKDLTAKPINTRSKQIVDRLIRNNKVSWDNYYFVIQPLIYLLPKKIDKDVFLVKAYSAFIINNINNYISDLSSNRICITVRSKEDCYPDAVEETNFLPVSDRIDLFFNNDEPEGKKIIDQLISKYDYFVRDLRLLDSSLIKNSSVPNTIFYSYDINSLEFPIQVWSKGLNEIPLWMSEWIQAKTAVSSGNTTAALQHYKTAFEKAKYVAGPLFLPLYVEICAFCKFKYQELKKKNEEHLFDRFYEPLGADAAKYAALLGYAPGFSRDPKTLMPKALSPTKNLLIIKKIDKISLFFTEIINSVRDSNIQI